MVGRLGAVSFFMWNKLLLVGADFKWSKVKFENVTVGDFVRSKVSPAWNKMLEVRGSKR